MLSKDGRQAKSILAPLQDLESTRQSSHDQQERGVSFLVEGIRKALGFRIRELRSKQGYSQESFADKCGLHRTFMGTIERGESNLSFSNVVKVSQGLGITLSQLVSGIDESGSEPTKRPIAGEERTRRK
jgi:ribosome-binding protein aMBF1 (putative translation factor)